MASRTCWVKDHFSASLDLFSLFLHAAAAEGRFLYNTDPSSAWLSREWPWRSWASTATCTNQGMHGLPILLAAPLHHEVKSLKQGLIKVIIKLYRWGERGWRQGRCSCTLTSASQKPHDSLKMSLSLLGRKGKMIIILSVF